MSNIEGSETITILQATFYQGYVLPSFIQAGSVRNKSFIIFKHDKIWMYNSTTDNSLCNVSHIIGEEVDMVWNSSIPVESRDLVLQIDYNNLKKIMGNILKKDQATLLICQQRTEDNINLFNEEGSSYHFIMYVSKGNNDNHEGLEHQPVIRATWEGTMYRDPVDSKGITMKIPIYRTMMKAFSKYVGNIKIAIYDGEDGPGVLLTTIGQSDVKMIIQKFGVIPNKDKPSQSIESKMNNLQVGKSNAPIINIIEDVKPNEFIFNSTKINHLINLAICNEGCVRIYYTPGYDLRIAHRFGPWGEQNIYLTSSV